MFMTEASGQAEGDGVKETSRAPRALPWGASMR
jgi:hypothetical protein